MIASVKRIVTLVVGADTDHMKVVISQSEILSRNHTKISIKRGTFLRTPCTPSDDGCVK